MVVTSDWLCQKCLNAEKKRKENILNKMLILDEFLWGGRG